MNELALFAGAGGGILGGMLNGWKTVCAVEINEYCQRVLMQRQNDGIFEPFPIWGDITTFDGKPWNGCVDIVTGGFPCQDISVAGKGKGLDGERSGLWGEMARIIGEVRPKHVFVENSPALTIRGGTRVISDLTEMGYDCRWGVVGAHHVGAPHRRDRIWIVANSHSMRESQPKRIEQDQRRRASDSSQESNVANANSAQRERSCSPIGIQPQHANIGRTSWWEVEPGMGRMVDGMADRSHRLKAIGNGQVPGVVRKAWEILK
jgi:DNA (cytosine-5)-methyltransferase 1